MAVIPECQAEMSLALRAVAGFFHSSQHYPVDYAFVRLILYICYYVSQSLGIYIVCAAFKSDAEVHKVCLKIHNLFGIRLFMNPVHKRIVEPEEVLCNRFVCCQHKFLNKTVGGSALL